MGLEVVLAAVGLYLLVIAVLGVSVGKMIRWGTEDDALPPSPLTVDELLAEMDWHWPGGEWV